MSSGAGEGAGLVVRRSPERQKLDAAAKQREKLLRDVARARAALEVTREVARDVLPEFFARMEPLREQMVGIVRELIAHFDGPLGPESHLARRAQVKVRRLRDELMEGIPAELLELARAAGAPCDPKEGARASRPGSSRAAYREPEDAGYSAPRPNAGVGTTLRAVFRRLAIALHPDRTQEASERDRLTSVMKEVTRAYEAGDVARLMELERSLLATIPVDEVPASFDERTKALVKANTELRRQLRQLTAERKAFVRSLPFPFGRGDAAPVRERAQRALDAAIAELNDELAKLTALRGFVRRFVEGKMGIDEFLAGPDLTSTWTR